jgi:glucokinase
MVCLIGDIGATHTRFAVSAADFTMRCMRVYQTSASSNIFDALQHYLREPELRRLPRPTKAALAIAAALAGDEVVMTNISWSFKRSRLQEDLGFNVDLYNDFSAVAMAIPSLHNEDKLKLGGADPIHDGTIAVMGPGTGLGVAGLIRATDRWIDLSGEGGHATMMATTREESQVLDLLRLRWGHVSAERVLSGPGLANLYEAVCTLRGVETRRLTAEEITSAVLTSDGPRALTGMLCGKTFDLFCSMLGTVAGNLALTLGATGGVYIAGGILPRVKDHLAASQFRTRFEQKGRLADYVRRIPTYLIVHQAPALLGLVHAQGRRQIT